MASIPWFSSWRSLQDITDWKMYADKQIYPEASQPTFNKTHKQKAIAEYRSTQMSVSHYSILKWDFLLPF